MHMMYRGPAAYDICVLADVGGGNTWSGVVSAVDEEGTVLLDEAVLI